MKCNALMEECLRNVAENTVSAEDTAEIEHCIDRLFEDIAFEGGCLFMKTYNGQAVPENWTDKVEFEAWHNEILINSEFPERQITPSFALEFYKRFGARLIMACPERMCSVMSEDDGLWTFRFHIVREGEPLWISEDLEKFSQPILYEIVNGDSYAVLL